MHWDEHVVRLVAAERQEALAAEAQAGTAAAPWLGRIRRVLGRRRPARDLSPWLWTRPLDVANCESGRGMPW